MYKQIVDILKANTDLYKGTLYFSNATARELNGNEYTGKYPLVWMVSPISIAPTFNDQNILTENWTIDIAILDSDTLANRSEFMEEGYDDLLKIGYGLLNNIRIGLRESDLDIDFNISRITQVFKQQDQIHYGWRFTTTFIGFPDLNYCCSLFDHYEL